MYSNAPKQPHPIFSSMNLHDLEIWIRNNNKNLYDLSEVFCFDTDEGDDDELQAAREEYEAVAEDIFHHNNSN